MVVYVYEWGLAHLIKKTKIAKLRYMVTDFGFCKGFVGVLWWGCTLIRASLKIFDLGE